MSWSIRPLQAGDGGEMQRLHHRAIMATSEDFYTLEERKSWAFGLRPDQYVLPEGGYFDVVEADDVVIAFCDHGADEVIGLYIDPDFQGRGIGSALLRQAEGRMIASGTRLARVHSALSSQSFYARHRYREVARIEHKTRGGLLLRTAKLEKMLG